MNLWVIGMAYKQRSDKMSLPIETQKNYFIRTVTMYYVGKLLYNLDECVVLSKASWIPDTGRFHDFLKTGVANEVEPFISNVVIPISGIIDVTEWGHPLPTDQK